MLFIFVEVEGVVVGDSGFVFVIVLAGQACVSFDVLNEFRSQNIERIFAKSAVFRQIGLCGDVVLSQKGLREGADIHT